MAEGIGGGAVVAVVAEDVAMTTFEAGAVTVEFRGKRRRLEDEARVVEEYVLVGGKIVPLGGLEPGRAEVVEVGSSTVVPSAPRAIQGLRVRERWCEGCRLALEEEVGLGLAWDRVGGGVYMVMGRGVEVVVFLAGCPLLMDLAVPEGFMPVGEGQEVVVGEFKLFFLATIGHITHCKWYGRWL